MAREPGGTSRIQLQTLFSVGVTGGLTDGQLLERFATQRGEAAELAFAALFERHGPMVFRACRGILDDEHEAHDAFQATFLVLLRKRNTLRVRDSLGPWLHRVACRAAGRARVETQRRRVHERRAAEHAGGQRNDVAPCELTAILHQEVDRLPERYRGPIVLCDLQGRSYEETAQYLGCPVGTVRSRLARGRERLRRGLTRRGLAPSAAVLSAALAADAASAAIPAASTVATNQCARFLLAGAALTAGEVPVSVLVITEGVLKMFSLGKLKLVAASVLTAIGLAAGAGVLVAQQTTDKPPVPPVQGNAVDSDRRWVATLPGGGTIEVLGISPYPSRPDSWWRPDGSPLAEAPCDSPRRNVTMEARFVMRLIAARVTDLPEDADRGWSVKGAGGSGHSEAKKDGKTVPGVTTVLFGMPKELTACAVQFQAATGPWKTVGTSEGRGSQAVGTTSACYIFGEALAARKGTVLPVCYDIGDDAVRLVAVDRNGRERSPVGQSGGGVKNFFMTTAEFDRGPEAIQEFRLQTRPYKQVEVPGIALKPNGPR